MPVKSSTVRMPPPTVNGINTRLSNFAHHVNHRASGVRRCRDIQKYQFIRTCLIISCSQSQPDLLHLCRSTKFTPFTTRPLFTSRHGIILFVNILSALLLLILQNFSVSEVLYHCSFPDGTGRQTHFPAQPQHEYVCCTPVVAFTILSDPLLSNNRNVQNIHTALSGKSFKQSAVRF